MITSTSDIITEVFTSVLVYRMKDVHEIVRSVCTERLGKCISADPKYMLKDDYLKHVGWNCSDPAAVVRHQAVLALSTVVEVCVCPVYVCMYVCMCMYLCLQIEYFSFNLNFLLT